MLPALLILAADQVPTGTPTDSVAAIATLIGAISTFLVALTALLGLRRRRSRRKRSAGGDPLDAVEEEILSLRAALKTARANANDLTRQLKACREDRDQLQARLNLAIGELGGRDQIIADLRQQARQP